MNRLFWVAVVAAFGSTVVSAQATMANQAATAPVASAPAGTVAPTQTAAKPADRMICERQEVLGSRLQGRRVCKTASQWEEERRQAREDVQRAQTMRGCGGSGNQC